jgi:hypothetical protein
LNQWEVRREASVDIRALLQVVPCHFLPKHGAKVHHFESCNEGLLKAVTTLSYEVLDKQALVSGKHECGPFARAMNQRQDR